MRKKASWAPSIQRLEPRLAMIAEGTEFTLPTINVDPVGFEGQVEARIQWGDGTVETVNLGEQSVPGRIRIRFDYSLDSGFFSQSSRRSALQDVADSITQYFNDTLSAITTGGQNSWSPRIFHPSSGSGLLGTQVDVSNRIQNVAANEIVVFAGARNLPGNAKGSGATAFFSSASGSQAFLDSVVARGNPGALPNSKTDHAPWGGSIAFDNDSDNNWYFGKDPNGIQPGQLDFYSFAAHELFHVLGFGLEAPSGSGVQTSWQNLISGSRFRGSSATANYPFSGSPPIQGGHWADSLSEQGFSTLMADTLTTGQRQALTRLDLASLDDLGWEIGLPPRKSLDAQHFFSDDPAGDGNEFLVEIEVTGSISGFQSYEQSVTVTNVAPTITTSPTARTVRIGQPVFVSTDQLQATEPGGDSITYSLDWGDGTTPATGTASTLTSPAPGRDGVFGISALRKYSSVGEFEASISIDDGDGGSDSAMFQVTVLPRVDLTVQLSGESVSEGSSNEIMVTVSRDGASDLIGLNLTVDGGGQFDVPTGLRLAEGETSTQFAVSAIDDQTAERDQAYDLDLMVTGYNTTTVGIEIADNEQPLFQNPENQFDVDGVNGTTVLDALRVINALGVRDGAFELDPEAEQPNGIFLDVSGDYRASPVDALQVINALARAQNSGPESESIVTSSIGGVAVVDLAAKQSSDDRFDEALTEEFGLF